jgi:thiamine-phosphate pyrophosphorylase
MRLCYVTDRKALFAHADEQTKRLLQKMEAAAHAGIDWIQIREKDLSGRELAVLVAEALRRIPRSCRILVNDRLDVALAVGAGGVHLGESSVPALEAKRMVKDRLGSADFLVGVSTHSLESVKAAEQFGADYVFFGPIFKTPSKIVLGKPQGLERLAKVCKNASIPVLAIGGISATAARGCIEAGASGIAAIRLFQDTENLEDLIRASLA